MDDPLAEARGGSKEPPPKTHPTQIWAATSAAFFDTNALGFPKDQTLMRQIYQTPGRAIAQTVVLIATIRAERQSALQAIERRTPSPRPLQRHHGRASFCDNPAYASRQSHARG